MNTNFLDFLLRKRPVNACFCTLAIHRPYRERARLLLADVPTMPWIVLTDEPNDFVDLPVRAIPHAPTGPMAIDFLTKNLPPTGNGRGRPAYHDKRFVLQTALAEFDTAIFVDADSRFKSLPKLPSFRPGIAVVKEVGGTVGNSRVASVREAAVLRSCGRSGFCDVELAFTDHFPLRMGP